MRDGDPTPSPVVSVENVHKVYRRGEAVPVLDGMSFALEGGSFTAIMGPSGSGKSTLLNLIGCLDRPTAGRVRINGRDVSTLSEDARADLRGNHLGFVFQTFNLLENLTAVENIALPLVFRGYTRADRLAHARQGLVDVGLEDRADHRPSELSGGQRQRVALARALVSDPTILLADEPTGNLDSETEREIMGLFEQVHSAGDTILLVTHERHLAEYAERIIHILDGDIERIEEIQDRRTTATDRWT